MGAGEVLLLLAAVMADGSDNCSVVGRSIAVILVMVVDVSGVIAAVVVVAAMTMCQCIVVKLLMALLTVLIYIL